MGRMLIVRSGRWLYDDAVHRPVDVVAFPFDYWHEFARSDETLEPGEEPDALGPSGNLFYVRFRAAGQRGERTVVDSGGHATVEAAMRTAQSRAPSPIAWDDA